MDIEETMKFILDTQAKLESGASLHDERLEKIEKTVQTLTDNMVLTARNMNRFTEMHTFLAQRLTETDTHIRLLTDAVAKLIERNGRDH